MTFVVAMILSLSGAAAAHTPEETPAARPAGESQDLPPALKALGIANARVPLENLLTSGQPTQEQMEALRGLGYTAFISLRPSQEQGTGWEEKFFEAGKTPFIRIPVAGPDDLTRENAQRLSRAIAAAAPGKAVVYCASSNRVGALLAVKAHEIDGLPAEDSLALGLKAGLKGLEPTVRTILGLPAATP
jgi:protein tyrosine phosphatase (PTP) superfamily phosphohydrolase (DUF442 family)